MVSVFFFGDLRGIFPHKEGERRGKGLGGRLSDGAEKVNKRGKCLVKSNLPGLPWFSIFAVSATQLLCFQNQTVCLTGSARRGYMVVCAKWTRLLRGLVGREGEGGRMCRAVPG